MDIIKRTTHILNLIQISVDVCDEPIYALTKEIQWRYPEDFGMHKYFCLFDSLHIEKSMLILNASLIKGTGLDKVMSLSGLSVIETQVLVNVNHIKQARYCLQVALCSIYNFLLVDAHKKSSDRNTIFNWLQLRSQESQMCFFWKVVLDIQVNVLIFIRSIREGKFLLYIASL